MPGSSVITAEARRTRNASRPRSSRSPGEPTRMAPRSTSVCGQRSRISKTNRAPRSLEASQPPKAANGWTVEPMTMSGRLLARLDDEERDEERQHVDLAPPRVAAVRERPEPDEPDAVEPLAAVEGAPDPSRFSTAAVVAEAGREDRHGMPARDELLAPACSAAIAGRLVGRRGVVVDDPDVPAAQCRTRPAAVLHGRLEPFTGDTVPCGRTCEPGAAVRPAWCTPEGSSAWRPSWPPSAAPKVLGTTASA